MIERVVFMRAGAFTIKAISLIPFYFVYTTVLRLRLLRILCVIHLNNDAPQTSGLVILHLTQSITTCCLTDKKMGAGLSGSVINWFRPRNCFVSIGNYESVRMSKGHTRRSSRLRSQIVSV